MFTNSVLLVTETFLRIFSTCLPTVLSDINNDSQVEQALLLPNPNDAEIKSRILFRHYNEHRSSMISTQDSLDLNYIASSGSSVSLFAYMELRRYYPNVSYQPGSYQPVQITCSSPYRTADADNSKSLWSAPNPASNYVWINYLAEEGQQANLKIVSVTDGIPVFDQELNTAVGQIQINLNAFHSGVYAYTLYINGEPKATERLLVVKQ